MGPTALMFILLNVSINLFLLGGAAILSESLIRRAHKPGEPQPWVRIYLSTACVTMLGVGVILGAIIQRWGVMQIIWAALGSTLIVSLCEWYIRLRKGKFYE